MSCGVDNISELGVVIWKEKDDELEDQINRHRRNRETRHTLGYCAAGRVISGHREGRNGLSRGRHMADILVKKKVSIT